MPQRRRVEDYGMIVINPRTGQPRAEIAYADRCGACGTAWEARSGWFLVEANTVGCAGCKRQWFVGRKLITRLGAL